MTKPRFGLPQLAGGLFLTDAGLETDMIYNHGFELPAFAAHTLLDTPEGRAALERYFRGFLDLARRHRAGFVLDCPTWRAQGSFAAELKVEETELFEANRRAVAFARDVRERYADDTLPVVLNGVIGPCGDAYAPMHRLTAIEAQDYHDQQVGWLAECGVDMLSALTLTYVEEAIGLVRAAQDHHVPAVISFTVETDGCLPSGVALGEAIRRVDRATGQGPAYYMINCAHPEHFADALEGAQWLRRLRGLRCNASRMSHAELDNCEALDDGNPGEFGRLYADLLQRMPWVNVLGGCCGSDLRHVAEVASAVGRMRKIA